MSSCVHIAGMEENRCLRQDVLRTSCFSQSRDMHKYNTLYMVKFIEQVLTKTS